MIRDDKEIINILEKRVKMSEAILDKIRAEIDEEYRNESEHPYGQGLKRAIEIIDKYKAESEE